MPEIGTLQSKTSIELECRKHFVPNNWNNEIKMKYEREVIDQCVKLQSRLPEGEIDAQKNAYRLRNGRLIGRLIHEAKRNLNIAFWNGQIDIEMTLVFVIFLIFWIDEKKNDWIFYISWYSLLPRFFLIQSLNVLNERQLNVGK